MPALTPLYDDASSCTPLQVATDDDGWRPHDLRCALNAKLGCRGSHVVVLDGLVSEEQRRQIMDELGGGASGEHEPPTALWDRGTVDAVGLPPSWGLRQSVLRRLESSPPRCLLQVHARLCRLFPEFHVCHMPAFVEDGGEDAPDDARPASRTSFVANAATHGDCFSWHVDADPRCLPRSAAWPHGAYTNGTRGKPRLISLLLYCDAVWEPAWQAETLFVTDRGVGLCVQPKPGRAVLLDQDVLHRVSAPSPLAKRPRFSLVWKLAFVPREPAPGEDVPPESIVRDEWGPPTCL